MGKTSGWPSVHSVLFSLRLVAVFFIFLFILTGWHSGESLSTPLPKNRHRLFPRRSREALQSDASRKKQRSSPRRQIFREGVSGSGSRPIPVQDVSESARNRLKRRQSVAYFQLRRVEDRIGLHRSGIRNNVRIDS
jgi:hypothetical protein